MTVVMLELTRSQWEHVLLCLRQETAGRPTIERDLARGTRTRLIAAWAGEPSPLLVRTDGGQPPILAFVEDDDLWAIEQAVAGAGPRGLKLSDGTPAMDLMHMLWGLLLERDTEGEHDARDERPGEDADADAEHGTDGAAAH